MSSIVFTNGVFDLNTMTFNNAISTEGMNHCGYDYVYADKTEAEENISHIFSEEELPYLAKTLLNNMILSHEKTEIIILFGCSRGKSTFLNSITHLFGSYTIESSISLPEEIEPYTDGLLLECNHCHITTSNNLNIINYDVENIKYIHMNSEFNNTNKSFRYSLFQLFLEYW